MGSSKYIRPSAAKVGGTWSGWHSFRRATADAYAEANVDPVVAATQLGHTVKEMQATYRSVRGEQAAAAAAALDAVRAAPTLLRVVGEE
jgi:integrase